MVVAVEFVPQCIAIDNAVVDVSLFIARRTAQNEVCLLGEFQYLGLAFADLAKQPPTQQQCTYSEKQTFPREQHQIVEPQSHLVLNE